MKNIKQIALFLIFAAFAAVSIACDGAASVSSDPNSPTNVSKRFVEAAKKKDVATFKSLLTKKSVAAMDKDAKEVNSTTDAMLAQLLAQDLFKTAGEPEFRNEKITGDKSTVEFKDTAGKWNENELLKEDGAWKVSLE